MKVLIVTMRYFGDCLLSAALARPIKERFPDARVELLTYRGNEKILQGCEEIDRVITVDNHLNTIEFLKRFFSDRHEYDWALITQESTRAVLAGFWLAKRQVKEKTLRSHRSWWKNLLTSDQVAHRTGHFLDIQASLLEPILGEIPLLDPIASTSDETIDEDIEHFCRQPFVVCHLFSRYGNKNWSDHEWVYLISKIQQKGYGIVLTGGPSGTEQKRVQSVADQLSDQNVINVAGRLSFAQTARVISQSVLYIGVDTATSHIAAATGVQTVCLFGPTDVRVWGPSPVKNRELYDNERAIQNNGNVIVVRSPKYLACRHGSGHGCRLNHQEPEKSLCMSTLSARWLWSYIEYREIL